MWRRVLGASIALMVLCVVGFVGTLVWRGFGGDYDKYGRVDIPGSGQVKLPAGEVDIDFAAVLTSTGGGILTVPDLHFDMTSPDGARDPVVTNSEGGSVIVQNAARERVWKLQVKDAGTYTVTTDGDVGGFIDPQLTFGQGSGVPAWPIALFSILFLVALGLLLVASSQLTHDRNGASRPHASSAPAPLLPPTSPATSPATSTPTTNTPEQEMARLAHLQQLTDLHTAGTLSDQEYEAAKARLGS